MRRWLEVIRKHVDLTMKETSTRAEISESYYSMIEAGERRPAVPTAKRIADVLGFDWTRFFDEENLTDKHNPPADQTDAS